MLTLVRKTIVSLRTIGLQQTLLRILQYPFRHRIAAARRKTFEGTVLSLDSIEQRFTEIYKMNYWGSAESVSGYGSTIEGTASIRARLPELLKQFEIKSIFDAPCGDFNWMPEVLKGSDVDYVGGDIVLPLIQSLNERHKSPRTQFIHIDLTRDEFPYADLMICRDCLFHLSFEDTKRLLHRFVESKTPYLLTTTYVNQGNFVNTDIKTGDARGVDLFSAPYNFPMDVEFRFEDPKTPTPIREMCLWTRSQVISALERFSGTLEREASGSRALNPVAADGAGFEPA